MVRIDCLNVYLWLLVAAVLTFTLSSHRAEALPAQELVSKSLSPLHTRFDEDSTNDLSLSSSESAELLTQTQHQSPESVERSSQPRYSHSTRLFARRRRALQWPHFDERDFYDVAADISRSSNPVVIRHYAKFINDNINDLIHDVCK